MHAFELVEKLPRGPSLSFFRTLKTLPDAFLGVGMGSNIEQSLRGFGVLHDGGCFPLPCEYYGALHMEESVIRIPSFSTKNVYVKITEA